MRRLRLITVAMAIALLIPIISVAPVAGASPQVTFVNGIPGRMVDVCVGPNEKRSNLGYGQRFRAPVAAGSRIIRFRVASPGKCKGAILAQRTLAFAADQSFTVVGSAKAPLKVAVFANPTTPSYAIRYAGDLGPVGFAEQAGTWVSPSVVTRFVKGDALETRLGASAVASLAAYRPGNAQPFLQSPLILFQEGLRTEVILVGSTNKNARFVVIRHTP